MEKFFNQKYFNYFVWTHKFATSVVDTGGNLPLASLTPVANLPSLSLTPVSTTQAELVAKNMPPVSLTPVVHVVHFVLQISQRIFAKNLK
jgi:hypothetical protein